MIRSLAASMCIVKSMTQGKRHSFAFVHIQLAFSLAPTYLNTSVVCQLLDRCLVLYPSLVECFWDSVSEFGEPLWGSMLELLGYLWELMTELYECLWKSMLELPEWLWELMLEL